MNSLSTRVLRSILKEIAIEIHMQLRVDIFAASSTFFSYPKVFYYFDTHHMWKSVVIKETCLQSDVMVGMILFWVLHIFILAITHSWHLVIYVLLDRAPRCLTRAHLLSRKTRCMCKHMFFEMALFSSSALLLLHIWLSVHVYIQVPIWLFADGGTSNANP